MSILKGLQRSTKIGLSIAVVFCAVLLGAIFTSSSVHAATTNKCRTMIYRSDTAGYTSGYVEVCADVKDDDTISKITSVNSNGTKGEILANVDAHFYNNTNISQQITVCRYNGSSCESGTKTQFFIGDKLGPADKNISQVYTKFSEYTDKVLYGVSDLVGYSTSQVVDDSRLDCENMIDNFCTTIPGTKKITYSYNGIYDGSYSDWENAGYPDGQGQTYTQPQDPNDPNAAGGGATSGSSETDPCYSASESLGWIVCPLTSWVGGVLKDLYSNIVEPFLQIDSGLVDTGNKGTYPAWNAFRGMANIVFVILILVVVFSQVTGVGVSNYGIKKALPKIIVVAVLVNLSYIVCQLAVDISNIVGFGVENLLSGLADDVKGTPGQNTPPSDAFGSILTGLGIGGGAFVAGATIFTAIGGGGAGIIVALLTVLTALLSVVFFFIILGLRKAGVVLLIALAPLAIVCAALPNTDKIFKRWLGIFKALLFIYPIAGALIGGGFLAAEILISAANGNGAVEIIGILLFVVPFLALPTLLKNSIAGADKIFGSIMNGGQNALGKAKGRLDDTNVMKRNREQMAKNRRDFNPRHPIGSFKAGRAEARSARTVRRNARDTRIVRADNQAVNSMAEGLMGQDVGDLAKGYEQALQNGDTINARAHMEALSQSGAGRRELSRLQNEAIGGTNEKAKATANSMMPHLMNNDNIRNKAPHIINDLSGKSANDLAAMDAEALHAIAEDPTLRDEYKQIAGTALSENRDRLNQKQITELDKIADPPASSATDNGGTSTPTAAGNNSSTGSGSTSSSTSNTNPSPSSNPSDGTATPPVVPPAPNNSGSTQSGHQQHNVNPHNAQPDQAFGGWHDTHRGGSHGGGTRGNGSHNNGPTNPTPPQPPSVPTS